MAQYGVAALYKKIKADAEQLIKIITETANEYRKSVKNPLLLKQLDNLIACTTGDFLNCPIERLSLVPFIDAYPEHRKDVILAGVDTVFASRVVKNNPLVIEQAIYNSETLEYKKKKIIECDIPPYYSKARDFIAACLMSCDCAKSLYGWGSFFFGDGREQDLALDIDLVILYDCPDLGRAEWIYLFNVRTTMEEIYRKEIQKYPYESEYDVVMIPASAISGSATVKDFTLFNLAHSRHIWGDDIRSAINVKYSPDMIDFWIKTAPRTHLANAQHYIRVGDYEKAKKALSKAILKALRGVAWKKYGYTESSLVGLLEILEKKEDPLAKLARLGLRLRYKKYSERYIESLSKKMTKEVLRIVEGLVS